MVRVSIVMPVYNTGEQLNKTLMSIHCTKRHYGIQDFEICAKK